MGWKMNKIKNYLAYAWHYYLIFALVTVIFWTIAFNIKSAPKRDEEVRIFISAYHVRTKELERDLKKLVDGKKIKNISVDYAYYGDGFFNYIFLTRGLTSSDIIITNASNLEVDLARYYVPFAREYLEENLNLDQDHQLLKQGNAIYGFPVYYASINLLSDYVTYESGEGEEVYMLINRNSEYFKNPQTDNNVHAVIELIFSYFREDRDV